MSFYRDKDGSPLTPAQWAAKFEDDAYRQIACTVVGRIQVSTIWTGTDPLAGLSEGPPRIFETMVFRLPHAWDVGGSRETLDGPGRVCTEAEAREQHEREVAQWSKVVIVV